MRTTNAMMEKIGSSKTVKASKLVDQTFEAIFAALSMAIRFFFMALNNVLFAALIMGLIPIFFGTKPIAFEEWQLIAKSESFHTSVMQLGAVFTILNIFARRGL